eukprot:m.121822 g.121822  ORF g.121822 m.121822 type:complete len:1079 (-) comp9382_c0_seq1:50-3286(-)
MDTLLPPTCSHLHILLDTSSSMGRLLNPTTSFLSNFIRTIRKKGIRVDVTTFSTEVTTFFPTTNDEFEFELLEFFQCLVPSGWTSTFEALSVAMSTPATTILLLTDGLPSSSPSKVVSICHEWLQKQDDVWLIPVYLVDDFDATTTNLFTYRNGNDAFEDKNTFALYGGRLIPASTSLSIFSSPLFDQEVLNFLHTLNVETSSPCYVFSASQLQTYTAYYLSSSQQKKPEKRIPTVTIAVEQPALNDIVNDSGDRERDANQDKPIDSVDDNNEAMAKSTNSDVNEHERLFGDMDEYLLQSKSSLEKKLQDTTFDRENNVDMTSDSRQRETQLIDEINSNTDDDFDEIGENMEAMCGLNVLCLHPYKLGFVRGVVDSVSELVVNSIDTSLQQHQQLYQKPQPPTFAHSQYITVVEVTTTTLDEKDVMQTHLMNVPVSDLIPDAHSSAIPPCSTTTVPPLYALVLSDPNHPLEVQSQSSSILMEETSCDESIYVPAEAVLQHKSFEPTFVYKLIDGQFVSVCAEDVIGISLEEYTNACMLYLKHANSSHKRSIDNMYKELNTMKESNTGKNAMGFQQTRETVAITKQKRGGRLNVPRVLIKDDAEGDESVSATTDNDQPFDCRDFKPSKPIYKDIYFGDEPAKRSPPTRKEMVAMEEEQSRIQCALAKQEAVRKRREAIVQKRMKEEQKRVDRLRHKAKRILASSLIGRNDLRDIEEGKGNEILFSQTMAQKHRQKREQKLQELHQQRQEKTEAKVKNLQQSELERRKKAHQKDFVREIEANLRNYTVLQINRQKQHFEISSRKEESVCIQAMENTARDRELQRRANELIRREEEYDASVRLRNANSQRKKAWKDKVNFENDPLKRTGRKAFPQSHSTFLGRPRSVPSSKTVVEEQHKKSVATSMNYSSSTLRGRYENTQQKKEKEAQVQLSTLLKQKIARQDQRNKEQETMGNLWAHVTQPSQLSNSSFSLPKNSFLSWDTKNKSTTEKSRVVVAQPLKRMPARNKDKPATSSFEDDLRLEWKRKQRAKQTRLEHRREQMGQQLCVEDKLSRHVQRARHFKNRTQDGFLVLSSDSRGVI